MKPLFKLAYGVLQLVFFFTRPITLGVRLLLIRDGQVLLVRHTYQNGWYLPGGGVKRGETLERAIRREAAEECGATLNQMKLFGMYTQFTEYKSDHIAVFSSTDFTLTGKSDREIECIAFFPCNDLPADIAPGNQRRIEEYLQGCTSGWGRW